MTYTEPRETNMFLLDIKTTFRENYFGCKRHTILSFALDFMQLKLYVGYSSCMEKASSTGTSEGFHFKKILLLNFLDTKSCVGT